VGWTSIYQLFWGSLGTRVLTHPHMFTNITNEPVLKTTAGRCSEMVDFTTQWFSWIPWIDWLEISTQLDRFYLVIWVDYHNNITTSGKRLHSELENQQKLRGKSTISMVKNSIAMWKSLGSMKGQLVKTEAVAAEVALELQRKSQVTKRGSFDRGGLTGLTW
jgi:hypothetical protein